MKVYSSKQAALNNRLNNRVDYQVGKYCTGKYQTTIDEVDPIKGTLALYKVYGKDAHGRYATLYSVYEVDHG